MKRMRITEDLFLTQLHMLPALQGETENQKHMISSQGNGGMNQDIPKIPPRHLPSSMSQK